MGESRKRMQLTLPTTPQSQPSSSMTTKRTDGADVEKANKRSKQRTSLLTQTQTRNGHERMQRRKRDRQRGCAASKSLMKFQETQRRDRSPRYRDWSRDSRSADKQRTWTISSACSPDSKPRLRIRQQSSVTTEFSSSFAHQARLPERVQGWSRRASEFRSRS